MHLRLGAHVFDFLSALCARVCSGRVPDRFRSLRGPSRTRFRQNFAILFRRFHRDLVGVCRLHLFGVALGLADMCVARCFSAGGVAGPYKRIQPSPTATWKHLPEFSTRSAKILSWFAGLCRSVAGMHRHPPKLTLRGASGVRRSREAI